jgi:hypothetical protein
MKFEVNSTYRWPMSEDEQSGFDTKPSMWFTVTKELSDEEVEVVWCDGTVEFMFHSALEDLYIPEVSAMGEYEKDE